MPVYKVDDNKNQFFVNFESEQSESNFEKHLIQQHGVKTLQCDVCQFKIRKNETDYMLRKQMDQHIFENHYSSFDANKISLSKVSVDRLKNMPSEQDLKQGIRTLQCDVCSFKIRKKESPHKLRKLMDQHIFEKHYSSFEANENFSAEILSLPKRTVHRLQKIETQRQRAKLTSDAKTAKKRKLHKILLNAEEKLHVAQLIADGATYNEVNSWHLMRFGKIMVKSKFHNHKIKHKKTLETHKFWFSKNSEES